MRDGVLDRESLEFNYVGKISNRQKIVLKLRILFWVCLASVEIFVLTGVMVMQVHGHMPWILIVGISALLVAMFYLCAMNIFSYGRDLRENKVRTSSGIIYKYKSSLSTERRGIRIWRYIIRAGKHSFSVSSSVYFLTEEGEPYRLFYLPHNHTLVNMEKL